MTHIYALTDPRDGRVRYIGKTRQSLEQRLEQHLYPHKLRSSCHRANWINGLRAAGLKPGIALVATVPDERENEYEIMFIAQYRQSGHDLTNQTDGGDGRAYPKGTKLSAEHCRKMSESKKGKPRPDMAERNRKRGQSPESRAKIAQARIGRKESPAVTERRVAHLRGRKRPDHSRAMKDIAARRERDPSTGLFVSQDGKVNTKSKYTCAQCDATFDRPQTYAAHMGKHADWSHLSQKRSEMMKRRWAEDRERIIESLHGRR